MGITTFVVFNSLEEEHKNKVLVGYSAAVMIWGKLLVANWRQRSVELKTRWQLNDIDGHEARRRSFQPEMKNKESGEYSVDADYYPPWKRYVILPMMIPFFAVLFSALYSCVLGLFWFEMYLVFDWGDCKSENEASLQRGEDPLCKSSAMTKGLVGTLAEITPGLMEAIFFEVSERPPAKRASHNTN